ncbi:hypothetical protein AB670_03989 [Chryseobacterium sp. MOF25P]|uniref:hypothetical protein n=1 Tax=unclassified Chryseobacterium TaxID=2593645 RepID=UPI00080486A7|nr:MULTISPECIES: hypothetical protein [unclassified Chryseobacterium]OBW39667.1 hypothetical protein AB670_03989 [Chryseobacterium sp. MOF25P]OBW43942.1 hypothetical protein AB671_03970 [Chryseobacterium sp. BGARF1]
MKKMGYVIGVLIGIPLFILLVNFLFFRGNNVTKNNVTEYLNHSFIDTVQLKPEVERSSTQYIIGLSRRGNPSAFLYRYLFYSEKYKKHFSLMLFKGFDSNSEERHMVLRRNENGDLLSVRINQDQLQSKKYGTKENPVPIFAIDLLNLQGGFSKNPFKVSEQTNLIFVEQYLKFFMPKEEFKNMFKE